MLKTNNPEFDEQLIDFEGELDTSLSFSENFGKLRAVYPALFGVIEIDEGQMISFERQERDLAEQYLLGQITDTPTLTNQAEIMDEISAYVYKDEIFTYSTLFSLLGSVNIINYGGVGLGKSRATKELLEMFQGYYKNDKFMSKHK